MTARERGRRQEPIVWFFCSGLGVAPSRIIRMPRKMRVQ